MGIEELLTRADIPEDAKSIIDAELKKRQQALNFLNILLDGSSDHIYFKDLKSRFILMNRAQAERFGLRNTSDAIGKTDFDYFSEEHAAQAYADEQEIISTGMPKEDMEERETWPDGRQTWVSTTKAPWYDESGKIMGTYGISRDITKSKKLEQKLSQAEKLEAIGLSTSSIVHDFNNHLGPIIGYIPLIIEMLKKGENPAAILTYLETIKSNAESAREIAKKVTGFSKEKREYNFEVFNLNDLVQSHLEQLQKLLTSRNIERDQSDYRLEFKPGSSYLIKGDKVQLCRIVENLITNAGDAMPNGGNLTIETKDVRIDSISHPEVKEGDYVMISVTDNGKGMDEKTKSNIFIPFFTTKSNGNGLGMHTIYQIAKEHGGFVDVYSEVGQGTTIKVYVPVSEKQKTIEQTVQDTKNLEGRESILVVDDDITILNITKTLLKPKGYRVLTALDMQQAETVYKSNTVDLVLLDLTIHNLPEDAVFKMIKSNNPSAAIFLMSGYPSSHADANLLSGSVGYIQKPFLGKDLQSSLRAALDSLKH
jgi:two-component system, cell cycle sensor histidine kinase and response regulator CckA